MELSVLADVVVVTHAEVGGILRGGIFVLARGAHDSVGAHDVSATQRRGAGTVRADHGVRPDHAVGAEGGVAEDVHAGTEPQLGPMVASSDTTQKGPTRRAGRDGRVLAD